MTKTYELVVNTTHDISDLYKLIGSYISTHFLKNISSIEDYVDGDTVISHYVNEKKHNYPDYTWWNTNTIFKGSSNCEPYCLLTTPHFYDSNFPAIIFSDSDSDSYVRKIIKNQFFSKFNTIIDPIDGSTLINEVKVLLDSNVFTSEFSEDYCKKILSEYEDYERIFSGYVINKVYVPIDKTFTKSMVFYLNEEPTKEIINNMINRVYSFIKNYETLMEVTNMNEYCFCPENIDIYYDLKILSVDLIEHITTTTSKRFIV